MATNSYNPDYVVHPGEYLEEVLESREIKKNELSARMGISGKHISQIINRKSLPSPDLAISLEKTLGISAEIWNNMSADYALFESRRNKVSYNKAWISLFPLKDLQSLGFIPRVSDVHEITERLLSYFAIPSPSLWESFYKKQAIQYRKSPAFKDNLHHLSAWIRAGEIKASGMDVNQYSKDVFQKNLAKIRSLTKETIKESIPQIEKLCAESGVAFVLIPEFDKTHVSGAVRWLSSKKALIIMSLRYKSNDHFWFTFFHEAGHVILHGKKMIFIDSPKGYESKEEDAANKFSSKKLIPEADYNAFKNKMQFQKSDIIAFAGKMKIHPGIVVGRLQHDAYIAYHAHNDLKEYIDFA